MSGFMDPNSERRTELRLSVFGEFPAKLHGEDNAKEYTFLPVDISQKGIGFLVSPAPEIGQFLQLRFVDQTVQLLCRHVDPMVSESIRGFDEIRRCGFALHHPDLDLVALCSRFPSILIGD